MFELKLFGNKAYMWTHLSDCYFIGYIFDENSNKLVGYNAIEYLKKNYTINSLESLPQVKGIFTFICINKDKVHIYVDNINYFPIFYIKNNNNVHLSDNWSYLINIKGGLKPHKESKFEFLSGGFVLKNDTLDYDIKKTKPSDNIRIDLQGKNHIIQSINYYPQEYKNRSTKDLFYESKQIFENITERLISFLNGKTAIVPLSGGFDSRIIVSMLKKANYNKVICFTYGKMNKEVEISKKVADKLGFKWYFIDYSKLNIDDFTNSPEFLTYVDEYANGFTMPYLQEFFAVKELIRRRLISDDSVFIPGHAGDNLGGSQVEKAMKVKAKTSNLGFHIANKYFTFKKPKGKDKKVLIGRIEKSLKQYPDEFIQDKVYNMYIGDWDIKERISKFICRSSKVFDFFGFQTIFPLMDGELVAFYTSLPPSLRKNKCFYDDFAVEYYFKIFNIAFDKEEISPTQWHIVLQKYKDKLRNYFPWSIVYKRMVKNDWMYYSELTKPMENELVNKGFKPLKKYKTFNAIICRWYLNKIGFFGGKHL